MKYWFLWRNLCFGKIKVRSKYFNFPGQIFEIYWETAETYLILTLYFRLILRVKSRKLFNKEYMITSSQKTNIESFSLLTVLIFKSYLNYKNIFCHKVALGTWLMNFFIWRKNNVLFSRYLDFCFCEIHKFKNLLCHYRHCCIMKVTLLLISFES